jgi:hypothetical protein
MAKTKISEWSSTPANNTDIDSINIAEGCAPSGINDAIRELMAQVKDLYSGTTGDAIGVAGGGTGQTSYTNGQLLIGNTTGNTLTKATLTAGSNVTITNGNGAITIAAAGGSPAGSNTQVQFNNSGAFGASANLTYGSNVLTSTGRIQIYNTSGTDGGFLRISSTGDVKFYDFEVNDSTGFSIQQNNDTRLTINNDGNIKLFNNISLGNATPTTSGTGITFPATQSASSNANTLDDYEEGTWTPTDASVAGLNFTVTGAQYVKVGQMVTVTAILQYPTTSSTAGCLLSGLPFSTNLDNTTGSVLSTNAGAQKALVNSGVNWLLFPLNSTTQSTNVTLSNATIYFSATYRATT